MARKYAAYAKDNCPMCGAVKSHQKFKPRKVQDFGKLVPIIDTNPVDGVKCPRCGNGFVVSHLECDDTYFADLDEQFEAVANFCPFCGAKVVERDVQVL